MSLLTFATMVLVGLAGYAAGVSLSAVTPRSQRAQPAWIDDAGGLRDHSGEPPGGPQFAARLRHRALVAGLALGMAMTIGRTLEDQTFESWRGGGTWVATLMPPRSTTTDRAMRVQPSAQPR